MCRGSTRGTPGMCRGEPRRFGTPWEYPRNPCRSKVMCDPIVTRDQKAKTLLDWRMLPPADKKQFIDHDEQLWVQKRLRELQGVRCVHQAESGVAEVKATPSQQIAAPKPKMVDAEVQCDVMDILTCTKDKLSLRDKSLARSIGRVSAIGVDLWSDPEEQYEVFRHFSYFEDPVTIASWIKSRRNSGAFSDDDLQALAGLFLGERSKALCDQSEAKRREDGGAPRQAKISAAFIAGAEYSSKNRSHRVSDRYVAEAAMICAHVPELRGWMLAAARNLLIDGIAAEPYDGQTLLCLASLDAEKWTEWARTALDYTARLMHAGVLPEEFRDEVRSSTAAGSTSSQELLQSSGFLRATSLPRANSAPAILIGTDDQWGWLGDIYPSMKEAQDQQQKAAPRVSKPLLRRTQSAPVTRTTGTSLTTQLDGVQREEEHGHYTRISFANLIEYF